MNLSPKQQAVDAVACGRDVLAQEIKGLQELLSSLNGDFTRAVECVEALRGRLIVTGMGKRGHVGRKIAATLASTGTPAHFVHPAEASHGDLGMITKEDAVLALSNSGETPELAAVIGYTRRFHIPLIAMVRRPTSMLVDAADIALVLPEVAEASPVGAPTTSTTMMMALGDALAVALIHRRGFTKEDFANYHPGGALGSRLRFVRDVMHKGAEMPLVSPDTLMKDALIEMTAKRFGCVGVVENGRLLGVITDGDLRRHMAPDLISMKAEAVMTRDPCTIRPSALAAEAVALINERAITSLFVVEDEKPAGILHIHDLLRVGAA